MFARTTVESEWKDEDRVKTIDFVDTWFMDTSREFGPSETETRARNWLINRLDCVEMIGEDRGNRFFELVKNLSGQYTGS